MAEDNIGSTSGIDATLSENPLLFLEKNVHSPVPAAWPLATAMRRDLDCRHRSVRRNLHGVGKLGPRFQSERGLQQCDPQAIDPRGELRGIVVQHSAECDAERQARPLPWS